MIGNQQVEAGVGSAVDRFQVLDNARAAVEKVGDQVTPRTQPRLFAMSVAVIRDGGEPAVAMHGQPGAAGLQVATADDVALIRPPVRRLRGARVKFVAIARDDQGQARMFAQGKDQQTHA